MAVQTDKSLQDAFLQKNLELVQESLRKQKPASREEMIAQYQRNHKQSMEERNLEENKK